MPERRVATAVFLATLAAIVVLSLLPEVPGEGRLFTPRSMNLMHLPAYMALGLATAWWVRPMVGQSLGHLLVVLAIVVVIGGGLELLQPTFGRDASMGDLLLDVGGGLLAALAWQSMRWSIRRSRRLA